MKRLRMALRQGLVLYLSLALLILGGLPENVAAALIPSNVGTADGGATIDRAADRQTIQRVLESKVVVQRLTDLGLSVDEVQASMDKLSPEDLHQIATNMDGVQAGGGVVGFVFVVLVLVVLVLLIVYLAKRV
jgi:uncharacterized protein DUF6627